MSFLESREGGQSQEVGGGLRNPAEGSLHTCMRRGAEMHALHLQNYSLLSLLSK